MFKFDFDIDDAEDGAGDLQIDQSVLVNEDEESTTYHENISEEISSEVSLGELISALPPALSFSPLSVPLSMGGEIVMSRRDLFDARFQLISGAEAATQDGRSESDIDFVDAPSDVVPGVYEGGLKTWECSLDLVDCLHSIYGDGIPPAVRGKRILELGCGTAVPSLYLLHTLFSIEPPAEGDVHVHLQDYNALVLQLVTLPNIILTWYMSPASSAYRSAAENCVTIDEDEDKGEPEPLPPADATQTGELLITPALTAAFLESLHAYRIHLKFFKGSWATFGVDQSNGKYDVLLTSETIYRTASLRSLVDLMKRATADRDIKRREGANIEESASRLTLSDTANLKGLSDEPYLCLVAAKLVYFGVGGGVNEFVEAVEKASGRVQTVWERSRGVRRSIMRVVWGTL
ncbi:hypothetical protein C8Q74DRAFT_1036021 [Fomes fomentarius]|nr:hypothetical protein C8Q74DRAFT_1036021 [Fomes fomentarius]